MHRFGRVLGANAPELPYYVLQCAHFCQNRARRTGCDAPMRALLPESCAKNRLRRSDARTFARIAREEQVATLQCAHFCQNCARRTGCDAPMRAFLPESRAKNRLRCSNARIFVRIAREEQVATLQCAHFCQNCARRTNCQVTQDSPAAGSRQFCHRSAGSGQRPGARRAFSRARRSARAGAAGSRKLRRRCQMVPPKNAGILCCSLFARDRGIIP